MLSRHFLRCKVLQELYACQMESKDSSTALREFDYHIANLNQLGVLQVSLRPLMIDVAEQVMEEGKKKFRPTQTERQPNRKFVDNIFLHRMADNFELKKHIENWGGCWQLNADLLKEAFLDFRQTKFYSDYLSTTGNEFASDKEFAIGLFRYLMNREALVGTLQERSLLWEDDFEQIAQYNYMMLKTLGEDTFDEAMQWPVMYDARVEKDKDGMDFARKLLTDSLSLREESDEMVRERLQGWEFERVALMDILLINMAVAELTGCPSIPERVTVDEYIELSKEFSTDRSKLFINGILDRLVLELRSKGRIKKSGRGLLSAPVDAIEDETEVQQ